MSKDVILPAGPLLLVHKGWQNQGNTDRFWLDGSHTAQQGLSEERVAVPASQRMISSGTVSEARTTRTTQPANTEYQFIDLSNQNEPTRPSASQSTRNLVRSHVSRARRPRKQSPKEPKKARQLRPSRSIEIPSPTTGEKGREAPWTIAPRPSLTAHPSGSSIPFFGGMRLAKPEFYLLANYYITAIAEDMYPLESLLKAAKQNPIRHEYFPIAITDELMLHSVCLSAAATISAKENLTTEKKYIVDQLMGTVITLLNERISTTSEVSDPTIAAVSCLAMLCTASGNHHMWATHMHGIRAMYLQRVQAAPVKDSVKMKIYRADIEGAIDSLSPPHLPFDPSESPTFIHLPILHTNNLFFSDISLPTLDPVQKSYLSVAYDISQTISFVASSTPCQNKPAIHPLTLEASVLSASASLLNNIPPAKSGHHSARAIFLATLIALKAFVRPPASVLATSGALVTELRSSLQHVKADSELFDNGDARSANTDDRLSESLLLWALVVGGGVANDQMDRGWLADKLRGLARYFVVEQSWKSARSVVRDYGIVWVDALHEEGGASFWQEAMGFES